MELKPPPVPWEQLPSWAHRPVVKTGIEALCKYFFQVGAADGFTLGFVAGLAAGALATGFLAISAFRAAAWFLWIRGGRQR